MVVDIKRIITDGVSTWKWYLLEITTQLHGCIDNFKKVDKGYHKEKFEGIGDKQKRDSIAGDLRLELELMLPCKYSWRNTDISHFREFLSDDRTTIISYLDDEQIDKLIAPSELSLIPKQGFRGSESTSKEALLEAGVCTGLKCTNPKRLHFYKQEN